MNELSNNSYSRDAVLILSALMIATYICIPKQMHMQLALSSSTIQESQIHRLTYMLIHANILHLILNVYSMLTLVFMSNAKLWHLVASIAIAAWLPDALIGDIPMCGISIASYALTGILCALSNRFWFLFVINAFLICPQFFMPALAVYGHVYGLIVGLSIGLFCRVFFTKSYE